MRHRPPQQPQPVQGNPGSPLVSDPTKPVPGGPLTDQHHPQSVQGSQQPAPTNPGSNPGLNPGGPLPDPQTDEKSTHMNRDPSVQAPANRIDDGTVSASAVPPSAAHPTPAAKAGEVKIFGHNDKEIVDGGDGKEHNEDGSLANAAADADKQYVTFADLRDVMAAFGAISSAPTTSAKVDAVIRFSDVLAKLTPTTLDDKLVEFAAAWNANPAIHQFVAGLIDQFLSRPTGAEAIVSEDHRQYLVANRAAFNLDPALTIEFVKVIADLIRMFGMFGRK